jgi:hypothetical protein
MAFLTTSSPIMVYSSPRSFGNQYSRSLRSRSSYLPYIILKLMNKQKGLIKSWNNICIVPSTTIKIVGRSCYHLPSLLTTTPCKDLFIRPFFCQLWVPPKVRSVRLQQSGKSSSQRPCYSIV